MITFVAVHLFHCVRRIENAALSVTSAEIVALASLAKFLCSWQKWLVSRRQAICNLKKAFEKLKLHLQSLPVFVFAAYSTFYFFLSNVSFYPINLKAFYLILRRLMNNYKSNLILSPVMGIINW